MISANLNLFQTLKEANVVEKNPIVKYTPTIALAKLAKIIKY